MDLPAAEKLSHDFQELRLREGPTLNKGLFAVSRLVSNIANEQKPDRVIEIGYIILFFGKKFMHNNDIIFEFIHSMMKIISRILNPSKKNLLFNDHVEGTS